MVRCVLLALEHPNAVGESFNVGNVTAVETSIGLAERVVRLTGSKSDISFVERVGVDVELRVPAVLKARDLLGFEAEVGLDEGIRRTADWMRARLGA
jgi:UDP-glucose 4-epimerase